MAPRPRPAAPGLAAPGLLAAASLVLLAACSTEREAAPRAAPTFPYELVEGEPLLDVLPPDAIPAIDDPRLVPADEADAFLAPDEPVLGVVGADGTAKAYSAWHLEEHEVVNDVLDGRPIAATW